MRVPYNIIFSHQVFDYLLHARYCARRKYVFEKYIGLIHRDFLGFLDYHWGQARTCCLTKDSCGKFEFPWKFYFAPSNQTSDSDLVFNEMYY